ncbi:DUF3164 family protein [Aliarcobacter butzleri]|uniref:DUF3164 family protein n=1 Tax=Aliarcobacter butzleri L352 TaxID=1447260 RepID=A0A837JDK4_9BACT|nr:DUF3164 family protein [Aliarcobacter butzleri]KLE05536.1 hypothetical protein AF77_04445 [Aliarcobacter butzleri L352]MCG3658624.1 DUF3164 family protein [Aliarcobacter butzleri]MCG3686765.1 DUF3164 family protein [Aliarcobacter butzleri]MDN5054408.1 DUF3164 family protein [Aliarcobacter butzleri]PZQ08319.1 MAG: DUF3164 domain-containing protein [Aliarcobacter butzleri]
MPTINEKGMWRNKEGDFIHPDMITPDKQLEDETVESIVKGALVLQKQMIEFKAKAFEECYGFVDLLRQKYNMERITSKSGTVTLKNFDGTKIVEIQVSKLISFDQKLSLAKEKIDEYLTLKTNGADAEIQTLITRVFDVKNGKVDAKQILSLKSYPIQHELWKEAMSMIDDATEIAGTKSYIRFKHRKNGEVDGSLEHIVLDLAGLEMPIKEVENENI